MGLIRITPKILELLLSKQRDSDSERVLIISVIDGKMILTERMCGLMKTPFIYPWMCTPKYENLKYIGIVDDKTGEMLSELELKMLSGGKNPRRIEETLSMYWDVILVNDEKDIDVRRLVVA